MRSLKMMVLLHVMVKPMEATPDPLKWEWGPLQGRNKLGRV